MRCTMPGVMRKRVEASDGIDACDRLFRTQCSGRDRAERGCIGRTDAEQQAPHHAAGRERRGHAARQTDGDRVSVDGCEDRTRSVILGSAGTQHPNRATERRQAAPIPRARPTAGAFSMLISAVRLYCG